MYGTWNRLNAVAASRNATSTQTPAATGPSAGGHREGEHEEHRQQRRAPSSMKRRRDPVRARLRSLRAPMTGSMMTSQTLARVDEEAGDERQRRRACR